MTDEMVGWHHQLDGHEFKQALGVGDGLGSLASWSQTWMRDWTDWKHFTNACLLNHKMFIYPEIILGASSGYILFLEEVGSWLLQPCLETRRKDESRSRKWTKFKKRCREHTTMIHDPACTCSSAQMISWAPPNPGKQDKVWYPLDPGDPSGRSGLITTGATCSLALWSCLPPSHSHTHTQLLISKTHTHTHPAVRVALVLPP